MRKDNKREKYLRKADDAEQQAQTALTPDAAATWKRIAAGYRVVADMIDTRTWSV